MSFRPEEGGTAAGPVPRPDARTDPALGPEPHDDPDDPALIHLEQHMIGGRHLDQPAQLDAYRRLFRMLHGRAVPVEEHLGRPVAWNWRAYSMAAPQSPSTRAALTWYDSKPCRCSGVGATRAWSASASRVSAVSRSPTIALLHEAVDRRLTKARTRSATATPPRCPVLVAGAACQVDQRDCRRSCELHFRLMVLRARSGGNQIWPERPGQPG
jgi:hypothetical protein